MELMILLLLHILSATIWTGGHLILVLTIVPKALKQNNIDLINQFEKLYHKLGMIALVIQILTGFRLAMIKLPVGEWFSFSDGLSSAIAFKFILLGLIVISIGLQKSIISKKNNIQLTSVLVIFVTIVSILFVYTGLAIRYGGF